VIYARFQSAQYLVLLLVFVGCGSFPNLHPYRVVAVNHGDNLIKGIKVIDSTGTFNYGCGNLGSRAYAAHAGPMDTPPNDRFDITWTDHLGGTHRQVSDFTRRLSPKFAGEIVLVFDEGGQLDVVVNDLQGQYPIPRRSGLPE
jgi:hypothetical protein